jgi:N6-adenosine-specific RNA methylase IME4
MTAGKDAIPSPTHHIIESPGRCRLIKLEDARRALAEAESIAEVRVIRDQAEAIRYLAKECGLGLAIVNDGAEMKLRAERRIGELLAEMQKNKGGRPLQSGSTLEPVRPKLKEMGTGKTQSHRAQQIASVPEVEFEAHIAAVRGDAKGELTTAGVLKLAKAADRRRRKEDVEAEPPPLPEGPFRVIVADPPWRYDARGDDPTHRAANPYPSMTVEEICSLPVAGLAHADCALWLWTTNAFMREAFDVLDAWGFAPKTILTWVKDRMGVGDWLRGRTEHCLLAVRGRPVIALTSQTTVIQGPLREHSRKPEEFYALVESLCPAPPGGRCELFARTSRPGWVAHGNQPGRFTAG